MPKNIWGINPITGKPECYALRFPEAEIPELLEQAKKAGWTQLGIGMWTSETNGDTTLDGSDTTSGEDDPTVDHEPVTTDD